MSPVEEIKIDASKLAELPFKLMGIGCHHDSLARINREIRDKFSRMDSKKRLEKGVAPAGGVPKSSIF